MNEQVGIWIDHQQAITVSVSGDRITTQTLDSEVGSHGRFSGSAHAAGEQQYEGRHGERLRRFYDRVIAQLARPQTLLIFGPGEAKLELKARLAATQTQPPDILDTETTGRLTEPQIV